MDPVVPDRPQAFRQARSAQVAWDQAGSRRTAAFSTGAAAVRCVLQSNSYVIASHGVRHHLYADDTQLHLAMRANNTAAGLSTFAALTADVKLWFMQNGLQLNPDKSETLVMGTANQLRAASSLTSVKVAGVDMPLADDIKVFV